MKRSALPTLKAKEATKFTRGIVSSEFKARSDGKIEGYGAVFGNVDTGLDIVEAGAFADSLKSGRPVKMLWQHDSWSPIGIWDEVNEDDTGLRVKGRILGEVELGREATALIKAGAVDGLSIGYRTVEYRYAETDDMRVRIIEKADLWEVSLVTFPMNPEARVDAVKAAAMAQRDFERQLGEGVPMSRTVASALMRDGWKGVQALSDSGDEDLSELMDVIIASDLREILS